MDSKRKFIHGFPLAPLKTHNEETFQALCLDIVFVNDAEVRELNRAYRDKDKPTDVLSFSQLEGGQGGMASDAIVPLALPLGDIVISLETAQRQADNSGHPLEEEILRLVVHGLLHLYGYEHEGVDEEAVEEMEAEEARLLRMVLPLSKDLVKETSR